MKKIILNATDFGTFSDITKVILSIKCSLPVYKELSSLSEFINTNDSINSIELNNQRFNFSIEVDDNDVNIDSFSVFLSGNNLIKILIYFDGITDYVEAIGELNS